MRHVRGHCPARQYSRKVSTDPKTQASFVFSSAKVLREFRETFAEEFCNFDWRLGLPTLCNSAMI